MREATTVKEISFNVGQEVITIPINSAILVNSREGYGTFNGKAFDVFKDEYSLTN